MSQHVLTAHPRFLDPRVQHQAARAGIIAPVLFAGVLVAITVASWNYLHDIGFRLGDHGDSAWPSSMAQGPVGWAQMLNFAVFGLLLAVFVRGLRQHFPRRRSGRIATALLMASVAGWLLVAFPEDGPPFGNPVTVAGYLHGLGFVTLSLTVFSSMLATAVALRDAPGWRGYTGLTTVAGVAVFGFLFGLVFFLEVATTLGIYGFFGTILAWVEVMAMRLRRLAATTA
jgi:uncharacterized protein DUF998